MCTGTAPGDGGSPRPELYVFSWVTHQPPTYPPTLALCLWTQIQEVTGFKTKVSVWWLLKKNDYMIQ